MANKMRFATTDQSHTEQVTIAAITRRCGAVLSSSPSPHPPAHHYVVLTCHGRSGCLL